MQFQSDYFWGLSNTAWSAISSISTCCAVLVALYFPISEKVGRRKKIFSIIEREIRKNFRVLEKAKKNHLLPLLGDNVPISVSIAFTIRQINLDYWEENKQAVSESSIKKYSEYVGINDELQQLSLFAQELLVERESTKYIEQIQLAFEKVYLDMKKYSKYW